MTVRTRALVPRFDPALDRAYEMLIGPEWVPALSGETFPCMDPYTGECWGQVPVAEVDDVDRAVGAARRQFETGEWPRLSAARRAATLRRLAVLITEHATELAHLQIHENGKLATEMIPGVDWLAQCCAFSAGLAEQLHGQVVFPGVPNMHAFTLREPVGVVAAITPWNSPLGLLGFKLFPALAAGCTIVIKPSEVTPVSTLRLAELCLEAGVPAGVVNVVTGFAAAGRRLVEHPGVDKIAFTGSTATGQWIAQTAGRRMARTSLELGGKSPNIVFADVDLEDAVHGIMGGIYAASGQTCIAGSRVLVHRDIHDDFVALLAERTEQLTLGDPLLPSTDIGPLASPRQLERVSAYLELGRTQARLVTGGERATDPEPLGRGFFVRPTVFAEVDSEMRVAQEEIFGPVACVLPFADEAEALRLANDTPFGLAAGVWTQDMALAHRLVNAVRAGTVWVNTYRIGHHYLPFGGVKLSGIGRETGLEAVEAYTEVKSVWVNHDKPQRFGR